MVSPIPNDLTTGESIVGFSGIGLSPDEVEQDNGPNATTAGVGKTETNIVRFMTLAQARIHAEGMESEQLAEHVSKNGWGDVLVTLTQLKPYIEILWGRFDELRGTETIAGCHTKKEFSEKCLNRSIRAVQFMLYGRTPKKANSTRSGKQPKVEQEEIVLDSGNDATPPAESADGVTPKEQSMSGPAQNANQGADEESQLGEESCSPGCGGDCEEEKVVENVTAPPLPQPAGDGVLIKEPDWKGILAHLVTTLEKCGEKLPAEIVTVMKTAQQLLDGKAKAEVSVAESEEPLPKGTPSEKASSEDGPRNMAGQDASEPATMATPKLGKRKKALKPRASIKVTECPTLQSLDEEERERGVMRATSGHPGRRQGDYVLNATGKWEFDPELAMGEAEEVVGAQPKQLPTKKSMTTAAKPCRVKKRVSGNIVDFPVFRDGDDLPEEVFDTKSDADAFCARLNSPSVTGIVSQEVNT